MKRKFYYIYWLALIITILCLLKFTPQYQLVCDPVACQPVPDSRGFPFKVPLGEYKYVDGSIYRQFDNVPLIIHQAKAIITNTIFYFLIISGIYFVIISPFHFIYRRLIKKAKKK